MLYETIVSHVTGRVETIRANDSGIARTVFNDAMRSPFLVSGILRSVSICGEATTLKFFRHQLAEVLGHEMSCPSHEIIRSTLK
jgi:hypothetical protein